MMSPEEEVEEDKSMRTMELSMNSIVGIDGPKSVKLIGTVRDEFVLILIDSSATHNFISSKLVEQMKLPLQGTKKYAITVCKGYQIFGKGVCKDLELELQGVRIQQDFYPFELSGADLVLGVAWLESLREARLNWKQLTMKYKVDKRLACLRGDPSLTKAMMSLDSLYKSLKEER